VNRTCPRGRERTNDYGDRIEKASGVREVWGAGVPLLLGDTTWGVLGFMHSNLTGGPPRRSQRPQAVASMLVQLKRESTRRAAPSTSPSTMT